MNKLIVNPNTPDAWETELRDGRTRIGRGLENDVVLDHSSISNEHCELEVLGGQAVLRDTASLAGSFVDGKIVELANLVTGKLFKIGEVELQFWSDATPSYAEPPIVEAQPAASAQQARRVGGCRHHPSTNARWRCTKCGHKYCDLCINMRAKGGSYCKSCGAVCESYQAPPEARAVTGTFWESLGEAFTYPFRGDGPVMLGLGTVLLLMLHYGRTIAAYGFVYGIAGITVMGVFGIGFFFNYAKQIIISTAHDENSMPDWPEITDTFDDLVRPFGQFLVLLTLTFIPIIIIGALTALAGPGGLADLHLLMLLTPVWWAMTAIGVLLAPIGVLALAVFETVGALNPVLLIRSLSRALLPYLACTAMLYLVLQTELILGSRLPRLLRVPVLPIVLVEFFNIYLLTVGMRILGHFYRHYRERMGWP